MDMPQETKERIGQLQLLEQNIQNFALQKQQFQSQLFEFESAIKELESTDAAYKIVGNIMIHSKKDTLKKELEQKKEIAELRIKNLEKQEKQLREKAQKLQDEVLGNMKENK